MRFGLAVLALAPATVLMGATLPTLTRGLTGDAHLSRAFGRLYAANTLGAIIGTFAAGLVLIELLGLTGTLAFAAACSGLAGLAALWLSREQATDLVPAEVAPSPATPARPSSDIARSRPTLAIAVAFVSGLTSLGYQVLWTRLLSSGTGNSTYVFTMILGTFLIGIAIGAAVFTALRSRIGRPVGAIAVAQVVVAALAFSSLVLVIGHPGPLDPSRVLESAMAIVGPVYGRPPDHDRHGLHVPGFVGAPRRRPGPSRLERRQAARGEHARRDHGHVRDPVRGDPARRLTDGGRRSRADQRRDRARPGRRCEELEPVLSRGDGRRRERRGLVIVVGAATPGTVVDPGTARVLEKGGTIYASREDEIASVQAGRINAQELWVTGTSMTLLTVDAKLMPVLPLMLRPDSKTALTVAFGMGSAFRSALIAGLKTDAVELVPSVPLMFGFFYPDASSVLANPNGRVIVTDGRNHVELTDKTYDIIVDRPAAADRELRRVGHLVARVLPGRPRPAEPRRDHDAVDAVRLDRRRVQGPSPHVPRGVPARPHRVRARRLRLLPLRLRPADGVRRRVDRRDPRPARGAEGDLLGLRLAAVDSRSAGAG